MLPNLNIPDYHQNPNELHIGCEAPRAYFIPFQSASAAEKAAKTVNRSTSKYFKSLCGEWKFKFFHNLYDVRTIDESQDGFD